MSDLIESNHLTNDEMQTYIKNNNGDLSIMERKELLQMIINSSTNYDKIETKGNGTQIKFKDIKPESTIILLYNYIVSRIHSKINAIQSFPDKKISCDE